ncbi:MAG TPA: hypothetical protein VM030_10520, partial [Acidimicrobiales bacterium]|nr:hypothetical protein [Acidimicrobiales bacterium]
NGALNLSILDGWWDEMFDGENGWAISSAEDHADLDRRDRFEADSLFDILERQVVPMFYERIEGPVPRRWVRRVKASLASLGPQVVASRMVRDYVEQLYEPIGARADIMSADGWARARALAAWKARVAGAWRDVHVEAVDTDVAVAALGNDRRVEGVVSLGALTADDVAVQLLHGPVVANDELDGQSAAPMSLVGLDDEPGRYRFAGSVRCHVTGRYGVTVRVMPSHPDLATPAELGLAAWP